MLRFADHQAPDLPRTSQQSQVRRSRPAWTRHLEIGDGTTAALMGVFGAVLAAMGSWSASLWTDEAATIAGARRTLPELWAMLQNVDAVHGLYYMLMHIWMELFGQSALSIRLPSALAVGLGAVGVYVLARRLGGSGLALLGSLVFVVLPRVMWTGIEARSFAFSATAAVWLSVLLFSALRRGTPWRWVAYAALSGVAIAVNLYLVLLLASHAITLLTLGQTTWRQRLSWLLSAGAGMVASLPVVYLSLTQSGQISDQELSWVRWMRNVIVNQWFLGDTPTIDGTVADAEQLWAISAVALASLCWLTMGLAVARALLSWPRAALPNWFVWVVPQILIPTLVIGLFSLWVHPMYNPRYLSLSTPAVAILIAVGLRLIPKYWMRTTAVVMIVLFAAPVYFSQRQSQAKSGADWNEVAEYVAEHRSENDAVYFSPRYPPAGNKATLTLRRIAVAYPDAFFGMRDITADVAGAQDSTLDGSSRVLVDSMDKLAGVKRVWMIRRLDYPESVALADERHLQTAGFQGHVVWSGPLDSVVEFKR